MKVSKAIEVLEDIHRLVEPSDPPEEHQALHLGIMALKKHQDREKLTYHGMLLSLPGETSEDEWSQ